MADPVVVQPAINSSNHGPQVIIVGGVMLTATVLMIVIAIYNRYNAKTMHHADGPLLLLGATLDVVFFALSAIDVKHGFGRHVHEFDQSQLQLIKQVFLGSLLVFYVSHAIIKISYNLLARQTARSDTYKIVVDSFSGVIALWAISNIVVIAVYMAKAASPTRAFFYASGVVSILIILGQLAAFLWIILGTNAKPKVKIRWSLSIGAFVPFCITAIIVRLAYTPEDYFHGDWTFNDVVQAMLFQIELNLVTMTVLAPNLPVFFQKTSTGGVFFLPGEATGGSKVGTNLSGSRTHGGAQTSYAMSNRMRRSMTRDGGVYLGKGDDIMTSTVTRGEENLRAKKASFDSDVILMRRSVEVERSSEVGSSHNHSDSGGRL